MKKNKTLVVVLAIVLTLSIGYALFSQTINITGTATAQGSFSFTPVCTIGIDSGIIPANSTAAAVTSSVIGSYNTFMSNANGYSYSTTIGGSSNNTCTVSGNTVTFATTLAYPGAMQLFTVKVTNTGTISGKLDTASLTSHIESGSTSTDGDLVGIYINGANRFPTTQTELTQLVSTYGEYEIVPNESIYIIYGFVWPSNSQTGCAGGSACTRSFTFELPFSQYNQ